MFSRMKVPVQISSNDFGGASEDAVLALFWQILLRLERLMIAAPSAEIEIEFFSSVDVDTFRFGRRRSPNPEDEEGPCALSSIVVKSAQEDSHLLN
jgi:hypothetical protein